MKASELSQHLAESADRVARELPPNGSKEGHEWRCGSIDGEAGKSLGVHLSGSKAGVWADFSAGTSGDLLDLWMAVRGCGLPEAMEQASRFIGVQIAEPERKVYPKPKRPTLEAVKKSRVYQWSSDDRKIDSGAIAAYCVASSDNGKYVVFPHLRNGEVCNYKLRKFQTKKTCALPVAANQISEIQGHMQEWIQRKRQSEAEEDWI